MTKNFVDVHGNSIELEMAVDSATPGLMTQQDKAKLDGIEAGANNYVQPTSFPATMITEDTGHKFITDAERTAWNAKAANIVATQSVNGLMSTTDKIKLDGIATGANAYTHPTTSGNKHIPSGGSSGQILRWSADGTAAWGADNNTTYSAATTSANGLMTAAMVTKLNGIATGANAYTHPSTHAATMITADSTHRFVTDTQISTWNAKAAGTHYHAASDITSGTLPVARGGTGATTAAGIASAAGLGNLGLACCARSTAGTNVSLPETTITKVPLNTFSSRTDSSVFTISNGGVKLSKAGTVLVSGSVYINLTTIDTPTGCYVYKGTSEVTSQFILQYASGAMSSGMKILTVAAGDILYLHTRSYKATTFNANLETTNLCITYLK